MTVNIQKMRVSDHLDLIRGLAAIAVLLYHVRYRFFFDYHDITTPSYFSFVFYTLSSFGHDAVMIFFVLSGYFISATVLRDHVANRWSWKRDFVSRLTRLYLVLLPGLLLTIFWDGLGLAFYADSPIYSGAPRPWLHDFFPVMERLNSYTFVANTLFLQMIQAFPFGSNAPLWSLSYEFWFYVLFPLAGCALAQPIRMTKLVVYLTFFIVVLLVIGKNIILYFPIWLLGTAVCLLPQVSFLKRKQSLMTTCIALSLFCGIVMVTHIGTLKSLLYNSVLFIDYLTATTFAILLYYMLHNQSLADRGTYAKVSKWLANFSYTLYVVHMPVLVFLRAALVTDTPWLPTPRYVSFGVAIASGCVVYAYVISRLTEAKTDLVRGKVMRWLIQPKKQGTVAT